MFSRWFWKQDWCWKLTCSVWRIKSIVMNVFRVLRTQTCAKYQFSFRIRHRRFYFTIRDSKFNSAVFKNGQSKIAKLKIHFNNGCVMRDMSFHCHLNSTIHPFIHLIIFLPTKNVAVILSSFTIRLNCHIPNFLVPFLNRKFEIWTSGKKVPKPI